MKKSIKILVMSILITFSVLGIYSFMKPAERNESSVDLLNQNSEKQIKIQINNSQNFIKEINDEKTIILANVKGQYYVEHEKTQDSIKIVEWFTMSKLELLVDYSVSFAINTEKIEFENKGNEVWVQYKEQDIYVYSVDITDFLTNETTALFGKKYKSNEVLKLEKIVETNIKEESISQANIIKAKGSLNDYLLDLSKKFQVSIIILCR